MDEETILEIICLLKHRNSTGILRNTPGNEQGTGWQSCLQGPINSRRWRDGDSGRLQPYISPMPFSTTTPPLVVNSEPTVVRAMMLAASAALPPIARTIT